MGNEAISVEWGHLIKGFESQVTESRLSVVGTGEPLKVLKTGLNEGQGQISDLKLVLAPVCRG